MKSTIGLICLLILSGGFISYIIILTRQKKSSIDVRIDELDEVFEQKQRIREITERMMNEFKYNNEYDKFMDMTRNKFISKLRECIPDSIISIDNSTDIFDIKLVTTTRDTNQNYAEWGSRTVKLLNRHKVILLGFKCKISINIDDKEAETRNIFIRIPVKYEKALVYIAIMASAGLRIETDSYAISELNAINDNNRIGIDYKGNFIKYLIREECGIHPVYKHWRK